MKKLISLLLALVMVFSFATVAFAAEDTANTYNLKSPRTEEAITIKKAYTVSGTTDNDLYPAEELTFSVSVPKDVTNPDTSLIEVGSIYVDGNSDQFMYITLPEYDTVGIYQYIITENPGKTQGVSYTDAQIAVKVLVEYDYDDEDEDEYNLKSSIVLATSDENGGKVDTFTNTYGVGTLTVKKTISGNLADANQYFKIRVTFNAEPIRNDDGEVIDYKGVKSDITYFGGQYTTAQTISNDWTNGTTFVDLELKADDTITFTNIPAGVTYTVVEDASHGVGANETFDPNSGSNTHYTITYTVNGEKADIVNDSIETGATDNVVVNNEKKTDVQTGITLDTLPFVLILAVCAGAVVLFVVKRRRSTEF